MRDELSGGAGTWRPSRVPLLTAVVLVAGSAAYLAWAWADASRQHEPVVLASREAPAAAAPAQAAAPAAPSPAAEATPSAVGLLSRPPAPQPVPATEPRIPRHRDPNGDLTPDLADHVNPGERPTMAQVIERLRANGVTGGLAAFSPPGTRPPLVGLAVPDDFELPPGYVRHFQATDDGQRIEPILMYSPHTPAVDAGGRAIAVPEDRVVPAEAAPAGLPIRRIVVPLPAEPGPGR